jgi:hypothetical protein
MQVGTFVNVPDHRIISATGYYSFVDSGRLARLEPRGRVALSGGVAVVDREAVARAMQAKIEAASSPLPGFRWQRRKVLRLRGIRSCDAKGHRHSRLPPEA